MGFDPKIQYIPAVSMEDNLKAAMHWLGWAVRELSVGRVPDMRETQAKQGDALRQAGEQLAQADETAIELYETQCAQEEINAQQDEALLELYEMLGG